MMLKLFSIISLPLFSLFIIFQNSAVHCESNEGRPKVTLSHGGVVVGSYLKTVNGNLVKAFRGIPYAEPPLDQLRFRNPVPAKSWSGEKLTDKDANICPQQNSYYRIFDTSGNEDCLYLNVYTPETVSGSKPLSVMVYLHGGGWMTGSGISTLYGPQRLLDFDVILVVGNYRLGALGFLSTGSEDCPGNFGLKDQTLMLKWVQQNIQAFGGNPNDVTIFGESAGGGSVGYHIFSNLSKGLFHKAILQSGTNFNEWALNEKAVAQERALKLGKNLNCPAEEGKWKALIDCLREKPAKDIASIVKEQFKYDVDPATIYALVVEPDSEGAFITKPSSEIDVAPSADVPVMIGITADEGVMKSGALLHLLNDDFISKFDEVLPVILFYDHKRKDVQAELTKRIDEFYFKGKRDWSKENHHNLTNLITDNWFAWGQDKFLRNRFAAAEKASAGPTYVYVFDHRGPKSTSEAFNAGPEYYGVCHTDELPYLFPYVYGDIKGEENDSKIKWALPLMWTNFAKTGNPTSDSSDIPKWVPADRFPLNFAHIGRKTEQNWTLLSNEQGLLDERMQFWRNLEKLY